MVAGFNCFFIHPNQLKDVSFQWPSQTIQDCLCSKQTKIYKRPSKRAGCGPTELIHVGKQTTLIFHSPRGEELNKHVNMDFYFLFNFPCKSRGFLSLIQTIKLHMFSFTPSDMRRNVYLKNLCFVIESTNNNSSQYRAGDLTNISFSET